MSSISEESEAGDDDEIIRDNQKDLNEQLSNHLSVENCLGDLNHFKEVNLQIFDFTSKLLIFILGYSRSL